MSTIRKELINTVINRIYASTYYNIYNDRHKRYEFHKQTILADESLTKDEKTIALKKLDKNYDRDKVLFNEGLKRNCENCNQECFATSYCENCVRNYLKTNFSNWMSGNDDINNLIQKCQNETLCQIK
jgi:hypothetical protein